MAAQLELTAQIEAILFVADGPIKVNALTRATGATKIEVEAAVAQLETDLAARGLRLTEEAGAYSLTTAPSTSAVVERFLGGQARSDLSRPALETLAIVAWRQPITRNQIEEIRGVASEQTLKNLLMRNLIVEAGNAETPGRPILYATSTKFLQHFGLTSRRQLPGFDDLANLKHED